MSPLRLALITHVRNQPLMLERQFQAWSRYSLELRRQVEFILVDDCSTRRIDEIPVHPANSVLLRSEHAVPWNYAVKNYGVFAASAPAVFTFNADHVLEAEGCERLLGNLEHLEQHYFLFKRSNPDPLAEARYRERPHIGSVCVQRQRYLAVGGIDAEFNQHYGYDDTFLLACLERTGLIRRVLEDVELINYSESRIIGDADFKRSPEWPRDPARNAALFAERKFRQEFQAALSCEGRWRIIRSESFS